MDKSAEFRDTKLSKAITLPNEDQVTSPRTTKGEISIPYHSEGTFNKDELAKQQSQGTVDSQNAIFSFQQEHQETHGYMDQGIAGATGIEELNVMLVLENGKEMGNSLC
ncbi:hypothetical protein V6N11_069359, partial [Hibiscus sabdariffa]